MGERIITEQTKWRALVDTCELKELKVFAAHLGWLEGQRVLTRDEYQRYDTACRYLNRLRLSTPFQERKRTAEKRNPLESLVSRDVLRECDTRRDLAEAICDALESMPHGSKISESRSTVHVGELIVHKPHHDWIDIRNAYRIGDLPPTQQLRSLGDAAWLLADYFLRPDSRGLVMEMGKRLAPETRTRKMPVEGHHAQRTDFTHA